MVERHHRSASCHRSANRVLMHKSMAGACHAGVTPAPRSAPTAHPVARHTGRAHPTSPGAPRPPRRRRPS
jgi:hypothetical protein